jgi:hypothetical protein
LYRVRQVWQATSRIDGGAAPPGLPRARRLARPDIANRPGLSEASTLHRTFKPCTGVAPGEHRRSRIAPAEGCAGTAAEGGHTRASDPADPSDTPP